jgi:hypothetical protein
MEIFRMRHGARAAGMVVLAAAMCACGGGSDNSALRDTVLAPTTASGQPGGDLDAVPSGATADMHDLSGAGLQAPALAALHAGHGKYTVINLGPAATIARINDKGQAAFDYAIEGVGRSAFFDGDQIIDIGSPTAEDTFVNEINKKGEVVGWTRILITDPLHAYRWTRSAGLSILPYHSAVENSYAGDINRHGEVVGMSGLPPPPSQAYRATRWSATNVLTSLAPVGFGESLASAINDSNASAGYAVAGDGNAHAFIWDAANTPTDLGTFGGDSAVASYINRHGEIAGLIRTGEGLDQVSQAYLWNPVDGLATVTPPGESSVISGLNDAGQAAGRTFALDSQITHAFLYSRGLGLIDLHQAAFERSSATELNRNGVVVGWMGSLGDEGFDSRAYRWSGGSAVDLNTRLHHPPDGLVLTEALAISARGDILANSNAGLVLLRACGCGTNAPVLGPIVGAEPQLGEAAAFTLSFRDRNTAQTHSATVDWGDGSGPQPALVSESNGQGTVSASHTYTSQGGYVITIRVTDSGGRSSSVIREVLVFNLGMASISGQGTLAGARGEPQRGLDAARSPLSFMLAAPLDPQHRATKDFTFRLKGGLLFKGETLERMSQAGNTVRLEGTGRLNGRSGYRFTLEATDGSAQGRAAHDRLTVRITQAERTSGKERVVLDLGSGSAASPALAGRSAQAGARIGTLPGKSIRLIQ